MFVGQNHNLLLALYLMVAVTLVCRGASSGAPAGFHSRSCNFPRTKQSACTECQQQQGATQVNQATWAAEWVGSLHP